MRPTHTSRTRRLTAAALVAMATLAPAGISLTTAAHAEEAPATTPAGTTPTPAPTPAATTPTTPTTPVATTPTLTGPATSARATWSAPTIYTEDSRITLVASGQIDGQATAHIALLAGVPACPASPLYPRQVASGARVTVTAASDLSTTPTPLAGTFTATTTLVPKDSGAYRLCGWIVGAPASNEASTVATYDQPVTVANRPATLNATFPDTVRAGDYFSVGITGSTATTGRRALVMAEPDTGQDCAAMRKAPSGKRPLQSVVGLPSGDFTKTLRLRFRSKTAGSYKVCVQIVEIADRNPEASAARTIAVTEGLKCVSSRSALTQRGTDLDTVRRRRDAAFQRLSAAKKKVAPARAKLIKARKASNRRIATARKAVSRAKSKAGKKKARRHLAAVKRTETKRIYKAGAPYRAANALVRQHNRSYKQYRTGASLLQETIVRTRKDLKKYCAQP